MAKSKKSKILAMALCASVMTGIYASPVMAAGQISGITLEDGSTTLVANDQIYINGVELSDDAVKADGGEFTQLTVTGGVLTVGGTSIDSTTGNTSVGGTLTVGGALTANGAANLNGGLTVNGDILFANKGLTVSADGIIIEDNGNLSLADGNVDVGGNLTVNGETTLEKTTVNGTLTAGATDVDSLTVNTDKFVVEADGNTTVGGTLTAGATTVDSLKSKGNAEVGGTLNVTGDTTLKNTTVNGTLNAGATTVDSLTVKGAATVDSLEVTKGIKAANNTFQLTDTGVLTVGGKATFTAGATVQNGLTVTGGASVAGNFAVTDGSLSVTNGGLSVTYGGLTVNNGDTTLSGKLDVGAGDFIVDTDGNTEFNGNLKIGHGNFTVDAATGNTVVEGTLNLGSLDDREVGEVIKGLEEYADELKGANLPDKVGGIERDPEAAGDPGDGTTTIENGAEFTETAMTMGDTIVESGKITVGAAADDQTIIDGGEITAKSLELDGKNVGKTIAGIERETITDEFGNKVSTTTIEGALKVSNNGLISNADGSFTVDSDGGLVAGGGTFAADTDGITMKAPVQMTLQGGYNYKGDSVIDLGTTISDIDDRLEVLEYKTQNINGSEGTTAGGEGGTAAIDVPATDAGHTGINGNVTVGGDITAGEDITAEGDVNGTNGNFSGEVTVGDGTTITTITGEGITTGETTIDGTGIDTVNGNFSGEVTVGDGTTITTITGEGITTGETTIDGTGIDTVNGNFSGEVTVGDGTTITTITGEGITTGDITAGTGTFDDVIIGENTTIDGDGMTVGEGTDIKDGNITVSGENGSTTINGGNITTGDITAGTGSIGNVDMNNTGIIVGDGTSITNETVKAQNGDFDNLTAGSGTFGTGNNKTVINNDGVTVGGENGTSITGEGITVGDKNGVSIKNDEVRVGGGEDGKGGSYMNDTDVVSGEGVSLNDTAERVGHLENRVGKLEDRIDKVGAMSAAIANLRTMGYDPAAPTEIAVGVGQYRSETGAALGLFHYPNKDFMLSLSVSTSGDEVMGGIGATWKFGCKSPEKVLAAEKEKAAKAKLAKAEAMKKAAKEAKIKAQQERHAKLAAERAAQAEAAK